MAESNPSVVEGSQTLFRMFSTASLAHFKAVIEEIEELMLLKIMAITEEIKAKLLTKLICFLQAFIIEAVDS